MRKFEYDVVEVAGQAADQKTALNAMGADGWVLTHVEHYGITQARAYFMREAREPDDGRGDAQRNVFDNREAEGERGRGPGAEDEASHEQSAQTDRADEQDRAAPEPQVELAPGTFETSGSADGDTKADAPPKAE